ncbi:hypothetical protein HAHE_32670 [Haloferula helveola]|uniref:Fibronectin type-III domain-containing protein n=1 Tax=Haloferula helveola TaxID=490095 RepID=A0ABN6H9V8_9BACT|nr:hypothetical protein HAHE_32670 [Haloferula helveola]
MRRFLLSFLVLITGLHAQDDLRFLSATTYNDPDSGNNFAYLMWQAEDPENLKNLDFEVYAKPGQPTSAAPFTRRGTMSFQTNTAVISALLDTTPDVLVDAALLEERIDGLFGSLLPAAGLTLPMKISGVMQVAQSDPDVFRRLLFFSRSHPFIGIVMGTAGSYRVNNNAVTFEVRSADGDAVSVEGRVTTDLTNPTPIPKPGPPVHLPDESASGHLNVKLRWGIPDALARRTALTYGFNVYRISRAFAESGGLHTTPPDPEVMTGLLTTDPDDVVLANQVPIMPIAVLTPAEAAVLGPDDPAFFTDDNGVILDGGTPLNDGDEFYYYIAARDLLGRPGQISDGTLIGICDRKRPNPPVRVRVNHIHENGSTPEDFFRISWQAPTTGDTPDSYYVYRWENPEAMLKAAYPFDPLANLVAGPIPHDPATTRYSVDDTGVGAPAIVPGSYRTTGDDGKTYWYSVRAVKNTACGDLPSANSSPAWGVLRDRFGPDAAGTKSVVFTEIGPEVTLGTMTTRSALPGEASTYTGNGDHFMRITVTRVDPRIDGAIIYRGFDNGTDPPTYNKLGSKLFSVGDDELEVKVAVPADYFARQDEGLLVIARDVEGNFAYKALLADDIPNPDNNRVVEVPFFADIAETVSSVTGGGVEGVGTHTTVDPGTGDTVPTVVAFDPSDDAREYKLYKRIDGAPLLLVDQGEVTDPAIEITVEDYALPANSSEVCYFLQYFDEHGNPSPLVDLGCVRTTSKVEMPVPILSQPEKTGTEATPQVILRWFCGTEGVQRFRIYIDDGDTRIPVNYSNELSLATLTSTVAVPSGTPTFSDPRFGEPLSGSFGGEAQGFTPYLTGRVGGNFGNPATPNEFEITLNVASGREYQFYIESVSPAGDRSLPSNTAPFLWTPSDPVVGPVVPWPARSLPPKDPGFITGIEAAYKENLTEDRFYPVVKIGEIVAENGGGANSSESGSEGGSPFRIPARYFSDFAELKLYTSSGGEESLPFVLYRYQVANEYFPDVSGDVVQVSPLIDRIRTAPGAGDASPIEIHDPFIDLLFESESDSYGVYVKDTQGAIRGSTYVYVLLRFKDNGEIDRAIPTNEVFIPFVDP